MSMALANESVAPSAPETPYWLIGTRHPAELAATIERCRV